MKDKFWDGVIIGELITIGVCCVASTLLLWRVLALLTRIALALEAAQ